MASGVVPIVTNVGGNRYIVDEDTGYLIDYPVEVEQVASLLRNLYVNRDKLRKKSIAARSRALDQFNIQKTLTELTKIYEELES